MYRNNSEQDYCVLGLSGMDLQYENNCKSVLFK